MKFEPANQNGKITPTQLKSKQSKFGLIVSHTGTVYGRPLYLKALSDAAIYKTVPVTFKGVEASTTTAVTIGTSTFQDTVSAILATTTLSTGTWSVWAEWPGEGIYCSKTTLDSLIEIQIAGGAKLGGSMSIAPTPASGSLVITEGSAVFTATMSTSTIVPGSMYWLVNGVQVATLPILDNKTTLTFTNFITGTNTVQAVWPAGDIGGTVYEAQQATISYTVLAGSTAGGDLNLTIKPVNYGILGEGNVSLTGTLTTSTSLPGNITFYKNNVALYSAPITNNSATYTFNNVDAVGTYTFHAVWDGNQTSNPRYITKQSTTATWRVLARETIPSMTLVVDPSYSDFSLPVRFTATLNTSTSVNTGTVTFLLNNNAIAVEPVVGQTATYQTTTLNTGTYIAAAYYSGSSQTPKYYPVYGNTLTMTVTTGVSIGAPLLLEVLSDPYLGTGAPYIVGETITLRATLNTSTQVVDYVRFSSNNSTIAYVNFNANNTATTTTVFTSTGSYLVEALWDGTYIGGVFYAGQNTGTTIAVAQGYELPVPIVLTASTPRVIDETIVFTATVTTSTVMQNTVTFYANTLTLGTAQFNSTTNKATLSTTIANSGTYTISAVWSGGYIEDYRYYIPKTSTTSSMFVDIADQLGGTFTLESSSSTNAILETTNFVAKLNTSTVISGTGAGTVTLSKGATVISTATIISNSATFAIANTSLGTGTYVMTAVWSGKTSAPKFYGKTSSTSQTIVPISTASIEILNLANHFVNNIDGSTISEINTATFRVTGTYVTHLPTGTISVYNTSTLLATGNLTNSQISLNWNANVAGLVNQGPKTLRIDYSGDTWNSTATTTSTWESKTRRSTQLAITLTGATLYRPDPIKITVSTTSSYFNNKFIDIYDNGSLLGSPMVINQQAVLQLDSVGINLGLHNLEARFNQDYAYETTTTTASYTLVKGIVPLTLNVVNPVSPDASVAPNRSRNYLDITPTAVYTLQGHTVVEFTCTSYVDGLLNYRFAQDNIGGGVHAFQLKFNDQDLTIGNVTGQPITYYCVQRWDSYGEDRRHVLRLWRGGLNTATTSIEYRGAGANQWGDSAETQTPELFSRWTSLTTGTVTLYDRLLPYRTGDYWLPVITEMRVASTSTHNGKTVGFFSGTNQLSTATLSNNSATYTLNMNTSSYQLSVRYEGDNVWGTTSSNTATLSTPKDDLALWAGNSEDVGMQLYNPIGFRRWIYYGYICSGTNANLGTGFFPVSIYNSYPLQENVNFLITATYTSATGTIFTATTTATITSGSNFVNVSLPNYGAFSADVEAGTSGSTYYNAGSTIIKQRIRL